MRYVIELDENDAEEFAADIASMDRTPYPDAAIVFGDVNTSTRTYRIVTIPTPVSRV